MHLVFLLVENLTYYKIGYNEQSLSGAMSTCALSSVKQAQCLHVR